MLDKDNTSFAMLAKLASKDHSLIGLLMDYPQKELKTYMINARDHFLELANSVYVIKYTQNKENKS